MKGVLKICWKVRREALRNSQRDYPDLIGVLEEGDSSILIRRFLG
ncbi:hypothetical protein [Pseudomonas nitroreducens]